MARVPLTRTQVLRWNENWSASDLTLIEYVLDSLPEDSTLYQSENGAPLIATAHGKRAAIIEPGHVYWTRAPGHAISTRLGCRGRSKVQTRARGPRGLPLRRSSPARPR